MLSQVPTMPKSGALGKVICSLHYPQLIKALSTAKLYRMCKEIIGTEYSNFLDKPPYQPNERVISLHSMAISAKCRRLAKPVLRRSVYVLFCLAGAYR